MKNFLMAIILSSLFLTSDAHCMASEVYQQTPNIIWNDYFRLMNRIENTIQKDRLEIKEYCLVKADTGKYAVDNARSEYFSTAVYLKEFDKWMMSEESRSLSMDELYELKRIIMRGFSLGIYSNTPSIEYANTIYSNCLHRFNVQ